MKPVILGIILLLCAWLTHERVKVWQSDLTLWPATIQVDPCLIRPHYQYAAALTQAGRNEEAGKQWQTIANIQLTGGCATP